jgi:hypothetical protein
VLDAALAFKRGTLQLQVTFLLIGSFLSFRKGAKTQSKRRRLLVTQERSLRMGVFVSDVLMQKITDGSFRYLCLQKRTALI